MTQSKSGQRSAPKSTTNAGKRFTEEERAAMRERAGELRAEGRRSSGEDKTDGESEVLAKLAAMPEPDRVIGERLHELIKSNAPSLSPRLWYGMPAYANKGGAVVCFFQNAQKFKTRYSTFGFSDKARIDEGQMWPTAYALKKLKAEEEARIIELVKKAVG